MPIGAQSFVEIESTGVNERSRFHTLCGDTKLAVAEDV